jgi:DNA invertase Pin-like site-specific DNA recombinase
MSAIRWGYGRVSTLDQNPRSQHDALLAAGVKPEHMYIETASTRLKLRPKLEELRKLFRAGDILTVTKADRIARSTLDLLQIVASLDEAEVKLELLSGAFNRDDPWGKALFGVQAVFAELERDLIRMRTMEGLASAKAHGNVGGRPRKIGPKQGTTVSRMRAGGASGREIAEALGVGVSTVNDYLRAN